MNRDELRKKLYSISENESIDFINHDFSIYQDRKDLKLPIHSYDNFIEMIYVYAGSCKQMINGNEVLMVEGDACILDMSASRTILDTTENDIIIHMVMLKSFISSSLLSRLSSNGVVSNFLINAISQSQHQHQYLVFHCKKNPLFKELVENLMCEYLDQKICSKEIIDSYLVIILGELLRGYQEEQIHNKKDEPYLGEILQYIEQNFIDCTLKSTAEQLNLHPNYISTFIRKKTGKTFKALVQEQRMIKASSLLMNSTLNIDDVADEVGYKNLGFFYKKFQAHFEMTPHEYRNRKPETPSKNQKGNKETQVNGLIKINPQVFHEIAYRATSEIEEVSKILESVPQSIASIFNRKKHHSGIEIEFDETKLKVDVYVSIKAGVSIKEIAKKIQGNIHQMIFEMTSIKTNEIYVHIVSIDFK